MRKLWALCASLRYGLPPEAVDFFIREGKLLGPWYSGKVIYHEGFSGIFPLIILIVVQQKGTIDGRFFL